MVIDTTERSFSYSFPINLPRSLIVVSAYHYRSAGRVTKGFFWTSKYTYRLSEQLKVLTWLTTAAQKYPVGLPIASYLALRAW